MSKKAMILWCIWIGLLDGIYCWVCAGLPNAGFMWVAFVSLPIFFCGGAEYKTFPTYFCSATSGVLWGSLSLWALGLTSIADPGINMLVTLIPIVAILCIVHMVLFPNTVLGNAPMVFGGFASCFGTGGQNSVWVIITLALGLVLGVLITEGGKIITKIVDKPVVDEPTVTT